ncbi:hypothetical protein CBER1_02539 [Cercospora berteroae]|uniref:Uncharacterized protein n=1 Tax=Cercospora berteroae TaxID=357750 RepID=A0A2S6C462_9PEZI|nr:hypothetical protein CBER1_02539 [Cercospora berteroae]
MASTEPVDHGEPPTEAETHQQEEQESERRIQAIIEDLNGFDREFAALSDFDRAIQGMQVSLSEAIKDMICRLYIVHLYIAARDGLGNSRSIVSSVLARLAHRPFGKDREEYEASLSAFRRDAAKCTADTFKSIRRRVAFLRGWLDQIRDLAKERCDGSRLQSACEGLNRDQQRALILGAARQFCEPPSCNEPVAEPVLDSCGTIKAAMVLLKAEELGECIQKMYESVDVKIRGELQEAFPSEFAKNLID